MTRSHIFIAILVPFLWGLNFTAAKFGVTQFPPIAVATVRFAIVALILIPLSERPKGKQWRLIVLISLVIGGLHYTFLFIGLAYSEAGASVVAYQLATPLTVIFAALLLHEPLTRPQILGFTLAVVGLLVLMGGRGLDHVSLGLGLIVASAGGLAAGNVMIRALGPFNAWMLNGWSAFFTVFQLALVSVLIEHSQLTAFFNAPPVAWVALGYTAIGGGVIGFGLWFWLIERHPVTTISPYLLLTPVFGVASGVLLLNEKLTLPLVVGAALLLASLGFTQLKFSNAKMAHSGGRD